MVDKIRHCKRLKSGMTKAAGSSPGVPCLAKPVLAALMSLTVSLIMPMSAQCKQPTAADKLSLGELLMFNGNTDGAINAFRYAINLNPKMWEAHKYLMQLYFGKGDTQNTKEECKEILKYQPKDQDTHLILGTILKLENDLEGAAKEFQAAAELKGPSSAMAYHHLGITLLQKGDLEGAEYHTGMAIKKDPKMHDARMTLAVIKFKNGKKDEAFQELDEAIKAKGKFPEAHNAKGDLYVADGKFKEAIAEYEESVKEEPKFAQGWASLANVKMQQGDTEGALAAFEKAKDINPQDKNNFYGLALMLEKAGRVNEALAEFQQGLMVDNDPQMQVQIKQHMDQLRGTGFNLGGLSAGSGLGPSIGGNPFGKSFADMIKIAPIEIPKPKKKGSASSGG